MREIVRAEFAGRLGAVVEAVAEPDSRDAAPFAETVLVALPTRAVKLRPGSVTA